MVLETILDIEFQDMVAGDKAIFYQVQQLNSFFILSMMFRVVLQLVLPIFCSNMKNLLSQQGAFLRWKSSPG